MKKGFTLLLAALVLLALTACGGTDKNDNNNSGGLTIDGASPAQISAIEATFRSLGIEPVSSERENLGDDAFLAFLDAFAVYSVTGADGREFGLILETEAYTVVAISETNGDGLLYGSLDPFFDALQAGIDELLGELGIHIDLDLSGFFDNW